MDFFIYRNNEFIEKLAPSEIKLTRSLSGVFFLTFKTQQNIQQNDVLKTKINDTDFTFNIVKEKDSYKAYHRIYDLSKKLFLRETDGADQFAIIGYEANKTALESYLTGFGFNLIDNLDASLKDNLKAVDYSSDNVLSALTKFLEAFGAEHEFNDRNIYIKTRVGLDIPQQFIQAGGNTNAITKEIDTSNIITRLYPKGKSDNLDVLENYYYNELRPVNYDFINKKIEDNPQLYIDSSVIGQYGVIEQIKEFDVKLHNLNGNVVSWGQISIDEENYNYIDIDKTIDLSILEANQCTLFMTKGFEQVQEVRIKYDSCTSTRIVYYPQLTNKDIYNIDFTNGSYILMGYITQTQYDEAKNQLITEANNYLEQHKEAKITYSINFAYFSEQDRQQINLSVNIGDAVRLIDKSQAIDTVVRVLDFEYDLKLGMYNKITFSNTFERMPVNSIIDEMYVKLSEQQKKIREEALLLNGSVQTARTALERHELLVQKQFYGNENEYVRIGSEDRNYQVHGLEIVPTLERIDWTEFRFQEVFEDVSYKVASGNKIETTTKDYFMSIRIDKNDTENLNNGNIISFSETMEKGEIGGYTYYPLGVVRFVAGKVAMPAIDKGFTLIHGDFIQTGTITADKIAAGTITADKLTSNFTISAGQYIQAGDANRNYKLDGTQGLIRGIYGTDYNIPVVVKTGMVSIYGSEGVYINIRDLHLTNYNVILTLHTNPINYLTYLNSPIALLTYTKDSNNPNNGFTIQANYITNAVWASSSGPLITIPTVPLDVWSDWYTIETIQGEKGIKVSLSFLAGSRIRAVLNFEHISAFQTINNYDLKVRVRKTGSVTELLEGELMLDNNEILYSSSQVSPGDPVTSAEAQRIAILNADRQFGHPIEVNYTIIGY